TRPALSDQCEDVAGITGQCMRSDNVVAVTRVGAIDAAIEGVPLRRCVVDTTTMAN
ncbi:MAG: hypothetical protein ACI9WS_002693, partial [Paraglaciecola psychrophila]